MAYAYKASIIIPTTGDGKPLLEHTLASIYEHCQDSNYELIVVDNASIDDTFDYVEQLKDHSFFDCKVVNNHQNAGFSGGVNQGIALATGEFICVMHNDITLTSNAIEQLISVLQQHPEIGIIGPAVNACFNEQQLLTEESNSTPQTIDFVDSCCFVMKAELGLRLDEQFELSYFEDRDLALQCASKNLSAAYVSEVVVEHRYASTTRVLTLDPESDIYWKNAAYFQSKWKLGPQLDEAFIQQPVLSQLIRIEQFINPRYPEKYLVDYIQTLLTREEITNLQSTDLGEDVLPIIARLMMILDERPLLRRFEEKLQKVTIPIYLARELAEYYFSKNIYSRAHLYVQSVDEDIRTLPFMIIEAEILVANRNLEEAAALIRSLIRYAPYNPVLLKLSGDIHKFTGNENEANSFYGLASQIYPGLDIQL